MIYLGADHRGFELKEKLKVFLEEEGYPFEDFGNVVYDPTDDYPDFGIRVAQKVSEDPENNRGILLCGSGVGMDIVANKFKGVRSALVWTDDEKFVKRTREADDTNVLSLPADYLSQTQVEKIVKLWLEAPKASEERHIRRVRKIKDFEKR